jgi:uncharacterized protein
MSMREAAPTRRVSARTASRHQNGVALKRPIMGGACLTCIWGPLAILTREALAPLGYDVQICYNCNRALSVPVVAKALETPPLNKWDRILGDPPPPKGKVDFGVTNSHTLWRAYTGDAYDDGPQTHLRLIAYIEDPHLLQAAAKRSLGLRDLAQIAEQKMPLTVLADRSYLVKAILAHYGLTRDQLESWGGKLNEGYGGDDTPNRQEFDVIITAHGGLAGNIENDLLYEATQKHDLAFLEFATDLMHEMAARYLLETVTVPIGLLRGITRPMTTLARNGQSVFCRDDLDENFAYTVARVLDENRSRFKYLNRPYFYDSRTVWKGIGNVPLHTGAERYYREVGYISSIGGR